MCGICGFSWEDRELGVKMAAAMHHRGPDQHGVLADRRVTLGHRRLSIIDRSEKGRQPMSNADGTVHIIYNGEVYNYPDIKQKLSRYEFRSATDTEVVLHAYEEYGTDCVKLLNGDFAFAIYDSRKKLLFLARDHIGVKPLYYYHDNGKFVFASELKAMLECPDIPRKVSRTALSYALTFRFIPWEDSILEGVRKLAPGHFLVYDLLTGKLEKQQYWDVSLAAETAESEDVFVQKIRETFLDSVERRLMSDVPLGVYLSGGIDSSSILAAMVHVRKNGAPVKTFSVGFGYGEYTDEVRHAARLSEEFSTDHHEFSIAADIVPEVPRIVWHNDEPISDTAHIPFYFLAKNAKKHVTVVLSGEGGDELFAGYEHYKFVPVLQRINRFGSLGYAATRLALAIAPDALIDLVFKYASALGDEAKKRALLALKAPTTMEKYLEIIAIFDDAEKTQLFAQPISDAIQQLRGNLTPYFSAGHQLNQMLRLELKTVLPESYLMKGDKMNMAFSVEGRVPLLDRRLVELAFRIPPAQKLRFLSEKYIFRKAMKGLVPDHILRRKKQRFYVPIDRWIRDLKPVYEDLLAKQHIERQGYFTYGHVRKMLDNYDRSKLFYSRQLWALLTFQLWHRMFIDGENVEKVALR